MEIFQGHKKCKNEMKRMCIRSKPKLDSIYVFRLNLTYANVKNNSYGYEKAKRL